MINKELRRELVAMRAEDLSVREELLASGELGGTYVPRMEDVHKKNAARLRELIKLHGWPTEEVAGKDGAEAAWLIAQHSVGEPEFQRRVLRLLERNLTRYSFSGIVRHGFAYWRSGVLSKEFPH